MVKLAWRLVPILLFVICFSLTSSSPVSRRPKGQPARRPNSHQSAGPLAAANRYPLTAGGPPRRAIQKRAVNDNFFEDDDGGKSNNVDYIDFGNLYKDEVTNGKSNEKLELEAKNKKRMVKNRHEKNKEKKKRKKKRKHKQSRFKRRDDGERRMFRVKLRPVTNLNPISLDPTNLANGGIDGRPSDGQLSDRQLIDRPSTNLISLECEDRLHCLVRHLANGENNKQAGADEMRLNKILDDLVKSGNGKTAQLPITGKPNNKTADVNAAGKKRPNYFGNFHLVIRIPKDRNLNELQNLTLISADDAKHQKELDKKIQRLQKLIDRLTNQIKAKSHKKIGGNFEGSGPNNSNDNDDDDRLDRLEIDTNEEITRHGFNRIKGNDLNGPNKSPDLNFKRLVCVKKPVTMATFCYFA